MRKRFWRVLSSMTAAVVLATSVQIPAFAADGEFDQTPVVEVENGESTEEVTDTPTATPTEEVIETPTATPTEEVTETPTATPTEEVTETPTEKPTEEVTETPTEKPTEEVTETPTATPTEEVTETPTEEVTETPTATPTEEVTETPTEMPTEEPTETPTEVPTDMPTEEPTPTPEVIPTPTEEPTPTPTEVPTEVPTEEVTETPTATPTEEVTETPTATPTEEVTETPTATPTEEVTETPTATPTEEVTETPTATPTEEPTETPTEEPTQVPTETPTEVPTDIPTEEPTPTPTPEVVPTPTEEPTPTPTEVPTEVPTATPTEEVTETPTATPTEEPTETPTEVPTDVPTEEPTPTPTPEVVPTPTEEPTPTPTEVPTEVPTATPTEEVTETPTATPTEEPTETPTEVPTDIPTEEPTPTPTPEVVPTPTEEPTPTPTEVPTETPTATPTEEPTATPTEEPTETPTATPTEEPTATPTEEPTATPTEEPTATPTEEPTATPTEIPTDIPTEEPTPTPTEVPTEEPTPTPTEEPIVPGEPIEVTDPENLQSEHDYANRIDQTWIYTSSGAVGLKVTFSNDSLLDADSDDYIYIYDKNMQLIGTYTGAQLAGAVLAIDGDTIQIRLVTDNTGTAYGFAVDSIATLDAIVIDTMPAMTEFYKGQVPDYTGIEVNGVYSDGSKVALTELVTFSEIDMNTVGEKTVTVTYKNLTESFTINYREPRIVSLEIENEPYKTEYYIGESFDPTGLTLLVLYEDGNTESVEKGIEILTKLSDKDGYQTMQFAYQGKIVEMYVSVKYRFTYFVPADGDSVFITGLDDLSLEELVIPSSINGIPVAYIVDGAFCNQTGLTSVTLPESLIGIGERAFDGCSGLTSIEVPDSVTAVGTDAFANIPGLTIYGNEGTAIADYAHAGQIRFISTASLKLDQTKLTFTDKGSKTLTAIVTMRNGKRNPNPAITWTSSNENVVKVSQSGVVTVVGAGTATITAAIDGFSATCTVSVSFPLVGITITEDALSLEKGETHALSYTLNPTYTSDKLTFVWSSSDNDIATVDQNGVVTAVGTKAGTAVIAIKASNGIYATISVTVSIPSIANATITMDTAVDCVNGPVKAIPVITYKGKTLVAGTDYTLTYTNYDRVGTATVVITGIGNFSGSVTKTYTVRAQVYSITYVLNGGVNGVGGPTEFTVLSDTLTFKLATKKGYVFGGWFSDADCTKRVYSIQKGSKGNRTLYAKWTPIGYSIQFVGNNATSGTVAALSNCAYDSTYTLSANAFVRKGYTFTGWNTKADGSGVAYANLAAVKNLTAVNGSAITLYAQWKLNTYTISYVTNGGTNSAQNATSYTVISAPISFKIPTRLGYTFNGWFSDSACTKRVYTIQTGSIGNRTLYAKWTPIVYTITYQANGGSDAGNATTYRIDTATFTFKVPTRTGYTFGGWFSDAACTQRVYSIQKGSTGNRTLYAKWTLNKYTISYVLNGGVNNSANPTSYTVTSAAISFKIPTRTGYTFNGWFSDAACTKRVYSIQTGSTGNCTLYAKWTVNKYTIQFAGNLSTSGSMASLSACSYTGEYTLPANAFARKGYTFTGWNTKADGTGKAFDNKAVVKNLSSVNGGNITLYAQWKVNTYSIKYVLNGGTISSGNPATYNVNSTVSFGTPSRNGCTFLGWYSDEACVSRVYSIPKGTIGNKILYAKWAVKVVTLNHVTATSFKQIKLDWSANREAKGYEVYRSSGAGANYQLIATVTTGTTYQDKSIREGVNYFYKVRSYIVEASGKKLYSDYSTAKSMTAPTAPKVSASLKTSDVGISWAEVYISNLGSKKLTIGGVDGKNKCSFYPYGGSASPVSGFLSKDKTGATHITSLDVVPGARGVAYFDLDKKLPISDSSSIVFYVNYDGCTYQVTAKPGSNSSIVPVED